MYCRQICHKFNQFVIDNTFYDTGPWITDILLPPPPPPENAYLCSEIPEASNQYVPNCKYVIHVSMSGPVVRGTFKGSGFHLQSQNMTLGKNNWYVEVNTM